MTQFTYKSTAIAGYRTFLNDPPSTQVLLQSLSESMFVNGVEVINSRLNSIKLDPLKITLNMHPNTEETETCEKSRLPPAVHVTPSSANQRKPDESPNQRVNNPWLLNPQHEIPPTPPPQVDSKPATFFQQRIG